MVRTLAGTARRMAGGCLHIRLHPHHQAVRAAADWGGHNHGRRKRECGPSWYRQRHLPGRRNACCCKQALELDAMDAAEFDRFADEYRQLHANNIRLSGESPEDLAAYQVGDVPPLLAAGGYPAEPAILDFGAGVGTSVAHFRKHVPRCSLTCLDISNKSLEIGRATFPGEANFVQFD